VQYLSLPSLNTWFSLSGKFNEISHIFSRSIASHFRHYCVMTLEVWLATVIGFLPRSLFVKAIFFYLANFLCRLILYSGEKYLLYASVSPWSKRQRFAWQILAWLLFSSLTSSFAGMSSLSLLWFASESTFMGSCYRMGAIWTLKWFRGSHSFMWTQYALRYPRNFLPERNRKVCHHTRKGSSLVPVKGHECSLPPKIIFCMNHFSIIFPSRFRSSKLSLPFKFL
jgi:hypothetical protein